MNSDTWTGKKAGAGFLAQKLSGWASALKELVLPDAKKTYLERCAKARKILDDLNHFERIFGEELKEDPFARREFTINGIQEAVNKARKIFEPSGKDTPSWLKGKCDEAFRNANLAVAKAKLRVFENTTTSYSYQEAETIAWDITKHFFDPETNKFASPDWEYEERIELAKQRANCITLARSGPEHYRTHETRWAAAYSGIDNPHYLYDEALVNAATKRAIDLSLVLGPESPVNYFTLERHGLVPQENILGKVLGLEMSKRPPFDPRWGGLWLAPKFK